MSSVRTAPQMLHSRESTPANPRRLRAVFPHYCSGRGVSSVVLDLCDAIERSEELKGLCTPEYWTTSAHPDRYRSYQRRLMPHTIARLLYRITGELRLYQGIVLRRYLATTKAGDLALLLPALPVHFYQALQERGAIVVQELINTAAPSYRAALQQAYDVLGWPAEGLTTDADTALEIARSEHTDLFFTCSPSVTTSYRALGIPESKFVETSYGFDPVRFAPMRTDDGRNGGRPTFLFAAAGCVRKGLPFLLEGWRKAKIRGRLLVVGTVANNVHSRCSWAWSDPTIEFRPFQEDLAPTYGEADAFVLPSVEEGSPIVSYLALAAGLPCILSPAAAGWLIRDQVEGLVHDPLDQGAMIEALRSMADDRELRARLGAGASLRAADYTWDKVAARRCRDLLARV